MKNEDLKGLQDGFIGSTQQMVNILNFLPDATFIINLEGEVIAWNRAMENMTGVKAVDILGKRGYSTLFHGIERPMLIDLAIKPNEEIENQYSNFKRENGALVAEIFVKVAYGNGMAYMWGHATALYDNDGNLIGAIESFRDITEKKKYVSAMRGYEQRIAEIINSLKESEQRLSAIIDSLPDATLAIDNEGRVMVWNKAVEEMTGIPAQEMIGKGDYEYAIPFYGKRQPMIIDLVLRQDKEVENNYQHIERKGKILLGINFCPTARGNGAYVKAAASPIYDYHGNIVGAIESIRESEPGPRQAD